MTEEEIAQITDIQKALEVVSNNGYNYYYLNDSLKSDREIAMKAVRGEVEAMASCPSKFKEDKAFVIEAIPFQPMIVEYISPKLQDNLNLMLLAVNENGYALQYASKRLKNNAKVVLTAIEGDPTAIAYASKELWDIAGSTPEENLKQFIKTGKLFKNLEKDLIKEDSISPKKIKI
jgi:DNA repair exonuclease SbcCD ATPase subunit